MDVYTALCIYCNTKQTGASSYGAVWMASGMQDSYLPATSPGIQFSNAALEGHAKPNGAAFSAHCTMLWVFSKSNFLKNSDILSVPHIQSAVFCVFASNCCASDVTFGVELQVGNLLKNGTLRPKNDYLEPL